MYRDESRWVILYLTKKRKTHSQPVFFERWGEMFFYIFANFRRCRCIINNHKSIDSHQDIFFQTYRTVFYQEFLDRLERKSNLLKKISTNVRFLNGVILIAHQWKKQKDIQEILSTKNNWMCDLDLLDMGCLGNINVVFRYGKHSFSWLPLTEINWRIWDG